MAEIKLLKEAPDYAPILAFWAYREWYTTRSIQFDLVVKSYRDRIDDNALPMAWVAVEDQIPVGMVSLKNNDLWSRKDLNPWLGSLFVLPEYRSRGIGNILINKVKDKARTFGYTSLYLFTDSNNNSLCNYYSKRNWNLLAEAKGNDENIVKIYFYKL